jgi:peptidoglycan/LPS O-acetylase OafA/YrhL
VIKHRSDIDGLRALAILPVVLYHGGASWLPGGFLGVDVFFVISGFLITSILADEIGTSKFSVKRFYLRRARRILPVLLVVLAATFLAGLLMLTPAEMKDLGRMVIATCLFGSNIALWMQSGYFDAAAELKPLLMTWSLGIEEQFYIFWPLVLLVAARSRARLATVAGALALISFGLAVWAIPGHPSAAFYLLPCRAWELLLGATLATVLRGGNADTRLIRVMRNGSSLAGLALVMAAILLLNRHSSIPGWPALLPCAGAALLIWAGERAIVNRLLLSARPMVLVGLISYSLYLWHWPLLTLARLRAGPEGLTPESTAVVLVLALGLSTITWRWVENRWRVGATSNPAATLARYAGLTAAVGFLGFSAVASSGFPSRVSFQALADPEPVASIYPTTTKCVARAKSTCGADGPVRQAVALWGDSQALAIAPGIERWAAQHERSFVLRTHNTCPPLAGADAVLDRIPFPFCRKFNDDVIAQLTADKEVQLVVLVARWAWYTETTDFVFDRHSVYLTDDAERIGGAANSRRVFNDALARSVAILTASGKKVLLVGQVPELGFDPASCLTRQELPAILVKRHECTVPTSLVSQRLKYSNDILSTYAGVEMVQVFFPADVFCDQSACRSSVGRQLLYADDNHVSAAGAKFLADRLDRYVTIPQSRNDRIGAPTTRMGKGA